MDLRALVEARAAAYRAIQARARVSLRCLDPDAAEAPPITSLTTGGDDDARAVTVRVQGPLDAWFGFDVRALIADLDEADPQSIHLLIESPGGFLSDGLALYNDLRGRARAGVTVTAEARGVVASAAVLPFLAAETRTMTTGTELMVHNPWSLLLLAGPADDIEDTVTKVVAGLRSAEKTYRDVLVERTGASRQQVTAWLKDETWFAPDEAVDGGFATAVSEDTAAAPTAQDAQARALAQRVLARWRLTHVQTTGDGIGMMQPMKPFASVDETKRKDTFTAWRGKPVADITTKRDEVERAMQIAFNEAGEDLDLAKVTAIGDGKSLAEKCEALIGVHSELSGLEDALKERTDLDRVAKAIRAGNRGGGVSAVDPTTVQLVRPAPRARLADLIRADFTAHGDLPPLGSAAFASQMASVPLKSTLSVRDDAILATLFKTDAGWAPESVRDPGYVPSRRHPIQFVDILPRSSTTQELVRYMEETTYTNAAAGVAEGAAAPESTLALTQKETAVRKIATHIPVTREEMEDEPQVESYLNDTLPFMVRQAVDLATLKGDGTAPNLRGLLKVTGIQDIDWTTTGTGTNVVRSKPLNVLRKAKTLIRFTGRSMATHYVLNPSVWDDIVLAESSAGGYYYGSPQNDFTERVWGLPVVLSDHLVSTLTADHVNGLIGDFLPMWIQLRLRRELETEWGYINDDWAKEIMRIKASIRLALVVKRPQAFATISMP